jgi:hypothetical protein
VHSFQLEIDQELVETLFNPLSLAIAYDPAQIVVVPVCDAQLHHSARLL